MYYVRNNRHNNSYKFICQKCVWGGEPTTHTLNLNFIYRRIWGNDIIFQTNISFWGVWGRGSTEISNFTPSTPPQKIEAVELQTLLMKTLWVNQILNGNWQHFHFTFIYIYIQCNVNWKRSDKSSEQKLKEFQWNPLNSCISLLMHKHKGEAWFSPVRITFEGARRILHNTHPSQIADHIWRRRRMRWILRNSTWRMS